MSSHLKLVVNPHAPWIYNINGTDCAGILCPVIKYLSTSINLTYQFVDGTEIGDQFPNNKCWTGFMGQFQSNVILSSFDMVYDIFM